MKRGKPVFVAVCLLEPWSNHEAGEIVRPRDWIAARLVAAGRAERV